MGGERGGGRLWRTAKVHWRLCRRPSRTKRLVAGGRCMREEVSLTWRPTAMSLRFCTSLLTLWWVWSW